MLESIIDWLVFLTTWAIQDPINYLVGAVATYIVLLVITTLTEDKCITLLTPFRIIANMFHSDIGPSVFFISILWGIIIWCGFWFGIPIAIAIFVCTLAKEKVEGELGLKNQIRSWLENKVIFDFRKDKIR